jgi:tRNA pseudouridine38-40 synthase
MLPDDIAFVSVEDSPRGFDPIGGPIDKHYQYKIYTGADKDVFEVGKYWHYPYPLDEEKMQQAADRFVGTKDFKSFASAKDTRTNSIRTIMDCNVNRDGDWITIDVRGNKFMYNMVRNMVGTLIEVGRERWQPDCIDEIIKSRDRRSAGMLAPPDGLYLMHINFGD